MKAVRNTLLALLLVGFSCDLRADLTEVAVVNTGGTEIVPGYVLQGSRNMRKLGKRSTTSSVVVPRLILESDIAPQPVIPALAAPELKPKPRFGYGSDWTPGKTAKTQATPVRAAVSAPYTPFYYFRPPYSTTEYYPANFFNYRSGYNYGCRPWFGFGPHLQIRIFR